MALLVRFTVREPIRGMSEHHPTAAQQYTLQEAWRFFTAIPTGRRLAFAAGFHAFVGYGLARGFPRSSCAFII